MTTSRNNSDNSINRKQGTVTVGSSSTTTTYHTEPGVCTANPQDLEVIRTAYNGVCGPLTAPIAHFIEKCLSAGMEPAVIVDAIERTGWARRPSPFYLRAILQRYLRDRIKTMDDVREDEEDRQEFQKQWGDDAWKEWFESTKVW